MLIMLHGKEGAYLVNADLIRYVHPRKHEYGHEAATIEFVDGRRDDVNESMWSIRNSIAYEQARPVTA